MMKRKLLWSMTLLVLVITGCVKEKMPRWQILDFDVKTALFAADGDTPNPIPIATGTELGIYVFDDEGNTIIGNMHYTVITDGVVSGIRIPSPCAGCVAALYSPAREAINDPSAIPFVHGDNVMWGSGTDGSIVMSHLCSQVTFEVRDSGGNPVTGASVEVSGFYEGASLDAKTGILTPGTANGAKVNSIGTPVCVFASPAGEPRRLQAHITIGSEGPYVIDFEHLFEPGVAYLITFTQMAVSATVVDWIDGGSVNADV